MVTPEAVVLDVQTAGLGSRALARVLDIMIQGIVLVFLAPILAAGSVGIAIYLFVVTIVAFGYPILWESLARGRTPGKMALGLRVVTRQGAPIRFRHALVRGLLGLGEVIALPPVGVIAMLSSANDQRLGDMAAGTIVIRERTATRVSPPVVFFPPRGWESYVDSLDVGAVSAAEYENVRTFLIRAQEMEPLPRSNLAARLAGSLVARMPQPVPAGAGPEVWLSCVACAYQRRHGGPTMPPPGPWGVGSMAPPGPWSPPGPWGPPQAQGPGPWGPPQAQGPGPWGPPAPPRAPDQPAPFPPGRANEGFTAPD